MGGYYVRKRMREWEGVGADERWKGFAGGL